MGQNRMNYYRCESFEEYAEKIESGWENQCPLPPEGDVDGVVFLAKGIWIKEEEHDNLPKNPDLG